jgi:hypothetical protein
MPYLRPLKELRQQFEELTHNLEVCHNIDHRRELLKRMKNVLEETDLVISSEVLHLNSTPADIAPTDSRQTRAEQE